MAEFLFIERTFELGERRVIARLYAPEPAPGGDWQCRWSILWPDHERTRRTVGIDGFQALMLAMQTVHLELVTSDPFKAGQLTYLGQTTLGLPEMWPGDPIFRPSPEAETS